MTVGHSTYKETCQSCRKHVCINGVGEVYRHRNAAGNVCPGSRCQSVETATPMTETELEDLRAEWARMEGS